MVIFEKFRKREEKKQPVKESPKSKTEVLPCVPAEPTGEEKKRREEEEEILETVKAKERLKKWLEGPMLMESEEEIDPKFIYVAGAEVFVVDKEGQGEAGWKLSCVDRKGKAVVYHEEKKEVKRVDLEEFKKDNPYVLLETGQYFEFEGKKYRLDFRSNNSNKKNVVYAFPKQTKEERKEQLASRAHEFRIEDVIAIIERSQEKQTK